MRFEKRLASAVAVALVFSARIALGNGRFPAANQLVVDRSNDQRIVVRTTFGLVQSLDAGVHWSWICESAIQAGGFQDPPLAIGGDGAILLGLTDGVHFGDATGCEWTSAHADFSGEEVIDLAGYSTHIFSASSASINGALETRVAASSDGGKHFTTIGSLLEDSSPITIEVAPSSGSRLYLGMLDGNLENGLIARSDDGGTTWLRSPAPAGPDSVYLSAVDPDDPDRVYVRSMFPSSVLFVSNDAGISWQEAYKSTSELTGFALSPDGKRVAVGSADGVEILDAGTATATPYAVLGTFATPVNCLAWYGTKLYACSTEADSGFSIGISADGQSEFSPLLRFVDLEPVVCPSNPLLVSCETAPCDIGELFDAGCVSTAVPIQGEAGASSQTPAPSQTPVPVTRTAEGGCNFGQSPKEHATEFGALTLLVGWLARHRRRRPRS